MVMNMTVLIYLVQVEYICYAAAADIAAVVVDCCCCCCYKRKYMGLLLPIQTLIRCWGM